MTSRFTEVGFIPNIWRWNNEKKKGTIDRPISNVAARGEGDLVSNVLHPPLSDALAPISMQTTRGKRTKDENWLSSNVYDHRRFLLKILHTLGHSMTRVISGSEPRVDDIEKRIRIRTTARGSRPIYFQNSFSIERSKKKDNELSGEGARFRVLIIQHTPNKWASFLETPLALGSRMLASPWHI